MTDLTETQATGEAPVEEPECRPMRADAMRNRRRILDAAEEIFARDGISVPVDVVAERAGVGVGTLYRHFPTKEALFEAIVLTRLSDLVDATKCCDEDDPGRAFFDFLMKMAEQVSLKHDLFDALAEAGIDFKARCGDSVEELEQGLDHLRRLAVDSGQVRGDVTTSEVMGLVIGACHGADRAGIDKQSSLQMMKVVCDGLKTR